MYDINRDWSIQHDKPAINSWYPCKHVDDYWKIIIQQRRISHVPGESASLYRIVSLRGADIGFDLTLGMARALLMKETRRSK